MEWVSDVSKQQRGQYDLLIEKVFLKHYEPGATQFSFKRDELIDAADELGIERPKNLGDVIYSYRFRKTLPAAITKTAPEGMEWIIRLAGTGRYRFTLVQNAVLRPSPGRLEIKVPDATPAIIVENAQGDEQALLAIVRYNRLIDLFLRLTCYSLQNHLRTQIPEVGQIEIDELYVGVNRRGEQCVVPVQAKGGKDKLSIVQVEQDVAFCRQKFPSLTCRPVAAQFMRDGAVALLELASSDTDDVVIANEAHYRLVPPGEISPEDLEQYRMGGPDE